MKRLEENQKSRSQGNHHGYTSQNSLGFYQSLGFQVVSRKQDGYGPGLDRFALQLDLKKPCDEL